ncbi:putative riboflavin kinase [Cimex lectularius]|uniref:Riboflavin kinase n=1 Tax=Cimex lectularius TaxID=79782 RepID=A0A8I6S9U2_CIMLE|nr:putative riboflavin kinase [Cimex lectularius]
MDFEKGLPLYVSGKVTTGFGRGSKELGIPTANYSDEVVRSLPTDLETGVYGGWAQVDGGHVHKMVMSVGWNLFYNNKEKTMEIHILHPFDKPFYGAEMKVCVVNYIRPMTDFSSVDELIAAIKTDIQTAQRELDLPQYSKYKNDPYFS